MNDIELTSWGNENVPPDGYNSYLASSNLFTKTIGLVIYIVDTNSWKNLKPEIGEKIQKNFELYKQNPTTCKWAWVHDDTQITASQLFLQTLFLSKNDESTRQILINMIQQHRDQQAKEQEPKEQGSSRLDQLLDEIRKNQI